MVWYCVLAAILLISCQIHVQSSPCSWVEVGKSWSKGFMAVVKIQMEETVDHWTLAIQFTQAVENFEAWKGIVTRISDVNYTIDNNCYNNKIYSCQCFQFQYLVRHQPQWTSNTTVNFNGRLTPTCSSDPCTEHEPSTGNSSLQITENGQSITQNINYNSSSGRLTIDVPSHNATIFQQNFSRAIITFHAATNTAIIKSGSSCVVSDIPDYINATGMPEFFEQLKKDNSLWDNDKKEIAYDMKMITSIVGPEERKALMPSLGNQCENEVIEKAESRRISQGAYEKLVNGEIITLDNISRNTRIKRSACKTPKSCTSRPPKSCGNFGWYNPGLYPDCTPQLNKCYVSMHDVSIGSVCLTCCMDSGSCDCKTEHPGMCMCEDITNKVKFKECYSCHCLDHMSPSGFGNCEKISMALGGKMCYVESTSTCTDKLPSDTENGLYKSAIACNLNQCKNKRRRKNVATLTPIEKQRLRTALTNSIASTTPWRNYADNGNYHGAPRNTICQERDGYCCEHGRNFPPWHRLYTVNMEQLLDEALPYWDWTQSGTVPDLFNGILGPIKKPYRSEATECDGTDVTHHRRGKDIEIDVEYLKRQTRLALDQTSFDYFTGQLQSVHGDLHIAMKCDMKTLESSAYDPVFFLHHSYVDYQFAYWQELHRLRNPDQPDLSLSDDIMEPFNDGTYNPFEITRRNSKAKDTVDYKKNLCFEYDNLLFDGKTPEEYLDPSNTRRGPSSRRVFVGVVMPKNSPSSVVEFDICNKENKCIKGGHLATFGPIDAKPSSDSVEDIISNYNMIEHEVTDAVDGDASFDTNSTARITSNDDLGILSGLEPIMIWRYDGGVQGGMVYLSHGSIRKSYGKLLSKYAEVKEN